MNKQAGKVTGTEEKTKDTQLNDCCLRAGTEGHAERLRPLPFFGSTFWFNHGGGKTTKNL
jgi:hypothetical protein